MIVNSDPCAFRVLGPVRVIASGGPVAFARRQQLDLLAFLLLHLDHAVAVHQIVDAMWGEAAPRTATTQIKNMLSGLRGALTDASAPLATVDRQPAGYQLRILQGHLDLTAFTTLLADARAATAPQTAARLLRQALTLWCGPSALAGIRATFAEAARAHLEEQRSSAWEALFDAELACANHTKIVAELTDAVAANPGRERLIAQLMLALYRGGRPTDALGVYRRARHTLADEYGIEPGVALRDLERLILVGDPALRRADSTGDEAGWTEAPVTISGGQPVEDDLGTASVRPVLSPVPAQLPLDVRGFAGRREELELLNVFISDIADQPAAVLIAAVMGTAGVGKTALAVHWAHQIADRFPDGQLYVNLRGFDSGGSAMSPAEAMRGFLDALAVPPERIPAGLDAQAALYRSLVAGRRMLVLLDNAVETEQVRPLLPGKSGCLVVVTSRNRLTSLVAVEGAHPLTLDVPTENEARELLVGRLGAARVAAETAAALQIARHCARLPLALAMVAARAAIHPTFSLATLAAELCDARDGLGALSGDDFHDDVRSVFSWSYQRLGPAAARVFRLFGEHRGPDISMPAVASLVGLGLEQVRPLLAELTRAHLITEHAPARFAIHALLRTYAGEVARTVESDDERRAAVGRVLDHYLHTGHAAALLLYPHRYQITLMPAQPGVTCSLLTGYEQALAWFTTEHSVLIAAVEQAAAESFGTHAWQLASILATYLHRRGHWNDWMATQNTALETVVRLSDRIGQAHTHGGLGLVCARLGRYDEAHGHLSRAIDLLSEFDDRIGLAYMHLRMSSVYDGQGDQAAALHHAQQALVLYRAGEHPAGQAQALNSVGWYHARLGHYWEAIAHCEQAVALHQELGDRQGSAHTLDSLGYAHHHLGRYQQAAAYYRQSLEMLREAGDRYYEAVALTHLGDTLHAAGHDHGAREAWGHALDILDELGHPDAEQVDRKLRELSPAPIATSTGPWPRPA